MAKARKPGSGRPVAKNPKNALISFRVSADVAAAIERHRDKMGVLSFSISDTAREIVLRALKSEGMT